VTLYLCKLEGEVLIESDDRVGCYQFLGEVLPPGLHLAITEITEHEDKLQAAHDQYAEAYAIALSMAQDFINGFVTEDELDVALTRSRMAGKNLDHEKYLVKQGAALLDAYVYKDGRGAE
jgi:hypothetical protein